MPDSATSDPRYLADVGSLDRILYIDLPILVVSLIDYDSRACLVDHVEQTSTMILQFPKCSKIIYRSRPTLYHLLLALSAQRAGFSYPQRPK